jgi:hypothetical protein
MPNPIRMRRRIGGGGIAVKAAHFNGAATQFLNIADNAALSMGAGVHPTIVLWVYPESIATVYLLSKDLGIAANTEYAMQLRSTAVVRILKSNGTTLNNIDSAPVPVNRWSFIAANYDGANLQISTNNGAFGQAADTNDIQDSTNNLRLGTRSDSSFPFTGSLAQVGIAKSILSAAELTELYNGGKGKSFAQLSAALAAKFTAYWDLDDAGGSGATWLDKASTNHLTAGTTTAAPTAVVLRR